jgi:serpin B
MLLARRVLVRGASMAICVVRLALPRFRISWGTVALGDQLKALGMALPFTKHADFSGLHGHKPPDDDSLMISEVFHKAMIEVNEEGTEAAAATAVIFDTASALPSISRPIPVFRADHPFLFVIRERRAGTILFLGRVTDPTREV